MKRVFLFLFIIIAVVFTISCTTKYDLITSVNPEGAGITTPADGTYDAGTTISIIAKPSSGYIFDHWSDSNMGTVESIKITMDTDKSITAYFKKQEFSLVALVNPINGGTVSPGNSNYFANTFASATAIPNEGYEFDHWSGDATSNSNQISVWMDCNKSVTANFRVSLAKALSPVCKGVGIPEAAAYNGEKGQRHPLLLLDADGHEHIWSDDFPSEWLASTVEETQLVVCIGKEQEQAIETCRYWTSGPPIVRYQYQLYVKLIEAKTGKTIASNILRGSEPFPCNNVEPYYLTRKEGSHVSVGDFREWLWKRLASPLSPYPGNWRDWNYRYWE